MARPLNISVAALWPDSASGCGNFARQTIHVRDEVASTELGATAVQALSDQPRRTRADGRSRGDLHRCGAPYTIRWCSSSLRHRSPVAHATDSTASEGPNTRQGRRLGSDFADRGPGSPRRARRAASARLPDGRTRSASCATGGSAAHASARPCSQSGFRRPARSRVRGTPERQEAAGVRSSLRRPRIDKPEDKMGTRSNTISADPRGRTRKTSETAVGSTIAWHQPEPAPTTRTNPKGTNSAIHQRSASVRLLPGSPCRGLGPPTQDTSAGGRSGR